MQQTTRPPGRSLLKSRHRAVCCLAVLWVIASSVRATDNTEFFETQIRPILVRHCYECHSGASDAPEGQLRVDFREGLLMGGENGPAIVPGRPQDSLLMSALRHESFEMPPTKKLADSVLADFEKWIRDGATDPRDKPPSQSTAAAETWKIQLAERRTWWSLQPPHQHVVPPCRNDRWSVEPIDRFICSSLDQAGLVPTAPANAGVLLRRLAFVLTGLPPDPTLVQSFPKAYAAAPDKALTTLVDKLLASPHFGERFARHWMDVVRYTDTYGYEWDIAAKGSWEYRDYLIRAFNTDIGFNQLIREQIAGDLLQQPRINARDRLNESMIGPMFFHLGEHRHGSSLAFNGIHQEMIDNKIDAFSKAFLAMTVACARCHDHKLDAVSQADYYALAGIFMTPRWTARSIDAPQKHASQIADLKRLRKEIRQSLGQMWTANRGPLTSAESLRDWAARNRQKLEAAGPEDVGWPLRQLTDQTVWVKPEKLRVSPATESTEIEMLPDGSILASGPVPDTDTYTVTFDTPPGRYSVLRLEALTHDSLGTRGPGRTPHGNFVLTGITARITPDSGSGSVQASTDQPFSSASADYSQPNYPVSSALKDVAGAGWGIGLGGNVDRTAKFVLKNPVRLPNGGRWSVRLEFNLGTKHVLGRFHLSVGSNTFATDSVPDVAELNAEATATLAELTREWQQIQAAREKTNSMFEAVTDFSHAGLPDGWVTDGDGMRHGYTTSAMPRVSLSDKSIVVEFLEPGYHTHSLSPKLPGALRIPNPSSFNGRRLSLRLKGGEWAGRRDIPQNAFLNEGPQFFDPKAPPKWTTVVAAALTNGVTRVLTEITTADLNSNFPPRTGVANAGGTRLPDNDDGFDKQSWFSVTGLVTSAAGGIPVDPLTEFNALYLGPAPGTSADAWQRLRDWLAAAVDRWSADESVAGDARLLNWMLANDMLPNSPAVVSPEIASLAAEYRRIEATIQTPRSANSMDERHVEPIDYRLNIRGDVYREADPVPRNFLQVFAEQHEVANTTASGRLELADYLSSDQNPQTARVYVNRVWQWVFGTGIVATPSDFGRLGARPSHPEMLDWLTIQFMNEGWSTKKLVRRLVLSQTFRQGSQVSPAALEQDPGNRLWHHYPTRRLEAEAIRDSLLAVSGGLNRTLYGRPIRPHRSAEDSQKRLFSGPLDGEGRRSIYIQMSIMEPPKFLVGFNLPDLKLPTGRRDESNVPAQALIMLNDPFVIQQSEHWARELVNGGDTTAEDRIRTMFVSALSRLPDENETRRWTNAAEQIAATPDVMHDTQAWAEIAHALYNTAEFIHFR